MSTPARRLADELLRWVTDDALLGEERLMTYDDARRRFGLPGTNIGMGRVLDDTYAILCDEVGEAIALGVVAYVVSKQTGVPGIDWDNEIAHGRTGPEAARSEARAVLVDRLLSA